MLNLEPGGVHICTHIEDSLVRVGSEDFSSEI